MVNVVVFEVENEFNIIFLELSRVAVLSRVVCQTQYLKTGIFTKIPCKLFIEHILQIYMYVRMLLA